ncbi:hypothetical protein [Sphingomonas paeninsulae]|nr:hypothetical protein [Sphingomonas paeninsulae]
MFPNDLLDQAQRDMEASSAISGRERFQAADEATIRNEGHHATAAGVKLIRGAIPMVASEITKWVDANAAKAGKGKAHTALSTLRRIDTHTLAYAALNAVHNGTLRLQSSAMVQLAAGQLVESEIVAQDLAAQQKALVAQRIADLKADGESTKGMPKEGRAVINRIASVVSAQGSAKSRSKVFKHMVAKHMDHADWPPEVLVKMGEPLVNAVLLTLPSIYEMAVSGGPKKAMVNAIRLTDEGLDLLASINDEMEWMFVVNKPMVVPRALGLT